METIPDSALDTIIRTKARDMYRAEYISMAHELKQLRERFNRGEDKPAPAAMSSTPFYSVAAHAAGVGGVNWQPPPATGGNAYNPMAAWASMTRSRMEKLMPGDFFVIPGPYDTVWARNKEWEIKRVF